MDYGFNSKEFRNAKIVTKDYNSFQTSKVIIGDKIYFFDQESKLDSLNKDQVSMIRATVGNYFLEGIALGGVFGGLLELRIILEANASNQNAQFTGLGLLIGAGVGAIVGLLIKDKKTVFKSNRFQMGFNHRKLYNQNFTSLNFQFNF